MYCPFCTHQETKVLESRIIEDSLRRRRECLKCANRFTTYERAVFNLTVIKKDGREQPFNIQKLTTSLEKACGKADAQTTRLMARQVEQKILKRKTNPIKTTDIGKLVLAELKKFDKMAYVRFATIHKSIDNPKALEKELHTIV